MIKKIIKYFEKKSRIFLATYTRLAYAIIIILVSYSSCTNSDEKKQNNTSISLLDTSTSKVENNINKIEDTSKIIGFWFTPHSAKVNINFFKNGRFEFNDYNLKFDKYEKLKGTYEIVDSTLILNYDDRPQQIFKFYKEEDGNYYIKKKGYYFVKGDSL